MAIISSKLIKAASLACLGLGIVFGASPALATILTRQEFNGNFALVELFTSSIYIGQNFPRSTDYSGFVVYDENDNLIDWAIAVEALDFQLDPDSAQTADITFEENSSDDWNLRIDFGIAFFVDPLFNLQRSADTRITLEGIYPWSVSYVFSDPQSNISITDLHTTSVPEPSTVLALFALATIPLFRKIT
jgi:hypothetical protein